jgi:tRNA dimethylallyltransferase
MHPKTVIIITGPTAVGKTALAVRIAEYYRTEIISADSRQCFHELNIGVARPSENELRAVPHHFIASHSIHEDVTAAVFEAYALHASAQIFTRSDVIVMTGGTGLYLRAFTEGMDDMPQVPKALRAEVQTLFNAGGINWLRNAIVAEDPLFAEEGEMQNPQRMMRALSFVRATGVSIRKFRRRTGAERPFRIIRIGLELPRQELYDRIEQRVDLMVEAGLLQEVESLLPYRHLNALQTVGYKELFNHLDGMVNLEEAIQMVKQHTRNYAKRQMTWFRKEDGMAWFHPGDDKSVFDWIRRSSQL